MNTERKFYAKPHRCNRCSVLIPGGTYGASCDACNGTVDAELNRAFQDWRTGEESSALVVPLGVVCELPSWRAAA